MTRQFLVPILLPGDPTAALQAAPKQYVDASKGGFTFMQDAVPTATALGQTWYETDTGAAYVWHNDGTSSQWVQYAPGAGAAGGSGGSGFTFVQDTAPTATKSGDTWFDLSTAASGGTSWVAVNEDPANPVSELVWVQFAPGAAAAPGPVNYSVEITGSSTSNGLRVEHGASLRAATVNGYAQITVVGVFGLSNNVNDYNMVIYAPDTPNFSPSGQEYKSRAIYPSTPANQWVPMQSTTLWTPITVGVKPRLSTAIFMAVPGSLYYWAFRASVMEMRA